MNNNQNLNEKMHTPPCTELHPGDIARIKSTELDLEELPEPIIRTQENVRTR